MVNLHQLRIFDTLVTTGSFTGAGRRLGISQPAVTMQVRELERSAGVQLLERGRRRLRLTGAGHALFRVSRQLAAVVDEAEAVVAQTRGAIVGSLRISASGTTGAYLLPDLLTTFRRRYPEVRVELEVSNSRRVLEQVQSFDADVGALGVPEDTPPVSFTDSAHLVARPFAREPLLLALPRRHPWAKRRSVDVAALAAEPLIVREAGSATRRILERRVETAGVTLHVAMELGSNEALKRAVEAGLGVAVVAAPVIGREVADGRLRSVRLRGPGLALVFFLVHHADRAHAPVLRAFLDLVPARRVAVRHRP